MDRKVVIFFSLFTLLMIGGSFAICLWVIPKDLNVGPLSKAGMIQWESENVVLEMKVSWALMITQMIGVICIVLLVGLRLKKWFRHNKPLTIQGYIFKITRVTGKSAYDIFRKAAEDWPVSEEQIEQDFNRYMSDNSVPYYVTDFIRKNKNYFDKMRTSIFMFKGIE
jgi:hypothetical protein